MIEDLLPSHLMMTMMDPKSRLNRLKFVADAEEMSIFAGHDTARPWLDGVATDGCGEGV
jgi:hypothetical protein